MFCPGLEQVLALVGKQHLSGGWAEMEWGVRSGGRMFERAYGAPFFDHIAAVEGLEDVYSKAMANLDHSCARLLSYHASFPLPCAPTAFLALTLALAMRVLWLWLSSGGDIRDS
jgi:hypothetical protein